MARLRVLVIALGGIAGFLLLVMLIMQGIRYWRARRRSKQP